MLLTSLFLHRFQQNLQQTDLKGILSFNCHLLFGECFPLRIALFRLGKFLALA